VKGEVPEDPDFTIPLGQAIVRREGTDVTVIAYMGMMYRAMEAAESCEGRHLGGDRWISDASTARYPDDHRVGP